MMDRMIREYRGEDVTIKDNPALDYGTRSEPLAVSQFEQETGLKADPAGFVVSSQYPWLGASPDGYVGEDALLEVKCPYGMKRSEEPEFKPISLMPHYYAQVQIQMICTDRNMCYFAQWAPNGFKREIVYRDPHWEKHNIPILKCFYDQYLLRRNADTIQEDALVEEYFALKEEKTKTENRMKEILQELVAATNEQGGEINGHKLYKVEKEGSVSYAKAIKDIAPDVDLEPYRGKPSEYWVLK